MRYMVGILEHGSNEIEMITVNSESADPRYVAKEAVLLYEKQAGNNDDEFQQWIQMNFAFSHNFKEFQDDMLNHDKKYPRMYISHPVKIKD